MEDCVLSAVGESTNSLIEDELQQWLDVTRGATDSNTNDICLPAAAAQNPDLEIFRP